MFLKPEDRTDCELFTAEDFLRHWAQIREIAWEDVQGPEVAVGSFMGSMVKELGDACGVDGEAPLYLRRGAYQGTELRVIAFPPGGAIATATLEELIACGTRQFLVLGMAGSLRPELPVGSLVIPTRAVREEGTSYHYLPPGEEALPSSRLVERLRVSCQQRGSAPQLGTIWSTDAPFRELRGKVKRYRAAGVLGVEMEAASLFAAAAYRGVEVALLLVISDVLADDGWQCAFGTEALGECLSRAARVMLQAAAGPG